MRWRPWQALVVASGLGLAVWTVSPVAAQSSSRAERLKAKRSATVRKKAAVEEKLRETKEKQESATAALYASQRALSAADRELRETRLRLRVAQDRLDYTEDRLKTVEAKLKKHMDAFWARMEVFYKQGTLGYVSVALGATDFEQFVDRSMLLRRIAEQDMELKKAIEEERSERLALVSTREKTVEELRTLKSRETTKRNELRETRDDRREILEKVRDERAHQDEIYEELQDTQKEIDQALYRLANPSMGSGGGGGGSFSGGFIRPCSGRITCNYGWRIHPILRTRRFHDGVDIGAGHGTTIRAAAAGTVIKSGWMRAYGNTIMINHGGGYVTLYGHCSSLISGVGSRVSQGQPVARVGSTGWSTGPHLHFSIYRNGSPTNPLR